MTKKHLRSIITFVLIVTLVAPFFTTTVSAEYENTYSNTGNMRDDIIGVALTQVGYTEGANNYTKYGVWYGMPNSPWCGMFVTWCADQAGIPTSILKRTGIANPSNFGLSYQDGSNYTPQKGDLFFKKGFSHVGLVYYTEGDYFYTVEGNTSTTTYDGTSVMIRKRKISDYYFSSPNYSGSSNNGGCTHDYEVKIEADHPHKEFKVCSKCGKKTYTGNTNTDSNCKTCIQEACSHTFGSWMKSNDSKHYRVCSKCELEEVKSHEWQTGKILKEATCVEEGSQQLICSVCNAESSKSIAATNEHIYTGFSYINESEHQKVCSMCNDQTVSAHTLSDVWDHDSLYHWTSCSDCGGHISHQEHIFSNGCMEPCDICGYVLEGGHKGNGEKLYNSSNHWESCIRCGMNTAESAHTYTSDCDEICDDCGYKRHITAAHKDVYYSNDTGHWSICSECNRQTEITSHVADQNAKDWESVYCIHCDFELRSSDKHVHTYASISSDAHTHWGTCQCGEIMEAEVHTWDIQTGECRVCGAEHVIEEKSNNFLANLWKQLWKK